VIDSGAVTITKDEKELVEQINEALANPARSLQRKGLPCKSTHLSKEQVSVLLNPSTMVNLKKIAYFVINCFPNV
jgi:hypothetical protein